jgi:hypothetical protein
VTWVGDTKVSDEARSDAKTSSCLLLNSIDVPLFSLGPVLPLCKTNHLVECQY